MGPFSIFPFMECNHGIISLHHKVSGRLSINYKELIIKDGIGYIEKTGEDPFQNPIYGFKVMILKTKKLVLLFQ